MHQAYDLLQNKEGFNLWSKNVGCKTSVLEKSFHFLSLSQKKVFRNLC